MKYETALLPLQPATLPRNTVAVVVDPLPLPSSPSLQDGLRFRPRRRGRGQSVLADPYFGVQLGDAKNECRDGKEGVATLSLLHGVARGRYGRCSFRVSSYFAVEQSRQRFWSLVGMDATRTYLGKPTLCKLIEGGEDVGGSNASRATLHGETRHELSLSPRDRRFFQRRRPWDRLLEFHGGASAPTARQ